MSESNPRGVHWSFWIVAVLALLYNIVGVLHFIGTMNTEAVAQLPEWNRAIIAARPMWAKIAFAVAVFGGALACLLLLFRSAFAFYAFLISLFGTIAQLIPLFSLVGSTIEGPFQIAMLFALPLVVAVFLVWYAKYTERKGWVGGRR